MRLIELRKDSDTYSSVASAISRNLSYSGIALVWIFAQRKDNVIQLDILLLWALLALAFSLVVDLAQYVAGYKLVHDFHRQKELEHKEEDGNIDEEAIDVLPPVYIKRTTNTMFVIKIILNVLSFSFIIAYIVKNLSLS